MLLQKLAMTNESWAENTCYIHQYKSHRTVTLSYVVSKNMSYGFTIFRLIAKMTACLQTHNDCARKMDSDSPRAEIEIALLIHSLYVIK